jgi:hypothetical protein
MVHAEPVRAKIPTPTPGEGARAQGMISALVSAGITGGYLASPGSKKSTASRPAPAAPAPGQRRRRIGVVRRPPPGPAAPSPRRSPPAPGRPAPGRPAPPHGRARQLPHHLDMYIGTTVGILDRARTATQ